LKILIHDYAGHPFQASLSRELARKGHVVRHAWFADDIGPKGNLNKKNYDSGDLKFIPIGENLEYSKTNLIKRRFGDLKYGKLVKDYIFEIKPDIVLCGNTPTEALSSIIDSCKNVGSKFVYWVQDLNGLAAKKLISKKNSIIGFAVGNYYIYLDRRHLEESDHIITITSDFSEKIIDMGVSNKNISTIKNWGSISEIPEISKKTNWRMQNNLEQNSLAIYTGTLALKHNPNMLETLSNKLPSHLNTKVIITAEGVGMEKLRQNNKKHQNNNLVLKNLVSMQELPEVLGSADILLALLERDAGNFSVPSKVLNYLCAGRPIVMAAPKENQAARLIHAIGAGIVVEPDDSEGFSNAVAFYMSNPNHSIIAGQRARTYAEENFNIDKISNDFLKVFEDLLY